MSETIDELRSRWQTDPSPQVSLQLAEEYRRLDRRRDAVEVLARALDEHPSHVASRVAMGRYQLELGDTDEARKWLEQVAAEDPTHLVANKLLVRLYLEIGDDKQARDRLDLYRLLNEGDSDIEMFEHQLAGGAVTPPVAEERRIRVVVPRNGDPFGSLVPGSASPDYWLRMAAEGIFPVGASGLASAGAAPSLRSASGLRAPAPTSATTVALEIGSMVPEVPTGATVTLASLYLDQGHFEDAERAFAEVLDREPENREARVGLEEARRRLEDQDREVGAPRIETRAPGTADLNTRKIAALKDYLRHLRAAADRN